MSGLAQRGLIVMPKLTPEQRSARARLAAHARWSKSDPTEGTRIAREAFLQRFEDEVDPDRKLAPAERKRRAESAKKAHFQGLALKASKARSKGGDAK